MWVYGAPSAKYSTDKKKKNICIYVCMYMYTYIYIVILYPRGPRRGPPRGRPPWRYNKMTIKQ